MMKRLAVLPMLALAACESQEPEPPSACSSIPEVPVYAGETTTVAACFTDPNGDRLVYSASSSNPGVATASPSDMPDTTVIVAGVAAGNAMVTVTARDPGGLTASQEFVATVHYRPEPLTANSAADLEPSWSPDGTAIAFASDRTGNYGIYVMDADGGNQTRLTDNSATDRYPSWSPDGTRIAFASDHDGNYDIYVMDADGGNQTRLPHNSATDRYPSWSPDGTRIAFASYRNRMFDIYVMDADGGNQTRLPHNSATDRYPSWSPDGTEIAFASDLYRNYDIFSIRIK